LLPLPGGQLLFLLGDASGHGGPAAVMMALTRMMLHSCPLISGVNRQPFCPLHQVAVQPPGVLLGHLNRILIENTLEEQFMTALCGTLDLTGGALRFANAGHPPPRWWRAATGQVGPLPDIGGLPLGIDPQAAYLEASIGIGPGDVIVAYTDGLTEASPLRPRARIRRDSGARRRPTRIAAAMNRRREAFGHERLDAALASAAARGAAAVKEGVVEALTSFLDGGLCQDDTTFVVIQRSPEHSRETLNRERWR
jgi:phosphoserine phosphatase RsbU/P